MLDLLVATAEQSQVAEPRAAAEMVMASQFTAMMVFPVWLSELKDRSHLWVSGIKHEAGTSSLHTGQCTIYDQSSISAHLVSTCSIMYIFWLNTKLSDFFAFVRILYILLETGDHRIFKAPRCKSMDDICVEVFCV